MEPVIDTILFADPTKEGLDSDSNENYIPKGHSRYRLNCRSGGSIGVIESVKGTIVKPFTYQTGKVFKVIGSCDDPVNNHIYYFVAGSSYHYILRYNTITDAITVVVEGPILNFNTENKIHNPKYIDGQLLWTDGVTPPRSIIIENAINFTNGVPAGLDSYAAITEQVLDAIIYPPTLPPQIAYESDLDRKVNNLRGAMWQFSYQYVYVDNEKSAWSSYSKVGKPVLDENVDGRFFEDQTINNRIRVTLNTGTNEVKRVNIAVRDSNYGEWVLVESIEKYSTAGVNEVAHNISYDFLFYNDYRGDALDQMDFVRPFDYIPLKSKAMDISDDERIIYANNLEGFENVDMDVDLSLVGSQYVPLPFPSKLPIIYTPATIVSPSITPSNFQLSFYVPPPPPNISKVTYKIDIYVTDSGANPWPVYGTSQPASLQWSISAVKNVPATQTEIMQAIRSAILSVFNGLNILLNYQFQFDYTNHVIKINAVDAVVDPTMSISGVTKVDVFYSAFEAAAKETIFKQGAYHQLGLAYYDRANRSGYVNSEGIKKQTIPIKRFYVPLANEVWSGDSNNYFYQFPILNINHQPPEWATHYQVVHSGNQSIAGSLMYYCPTSKMRIVTTDDTVRIKLNEAIVDAKTAIRNKQYGTYTFAPKDRVRIIARKLSNISPTINYIGEILDFEVTGYDEVTDEMVLPNFKPQNYGLTTGIPIGVAPYAGFFMEVYAPSRQKEENTIYREIGECYEIGNAGLSNRFHKGSHQDQTATDPAIVNMKFCGDSYLITRVGVRNNSQYSYPCESENYSDYYPSDSYDFGRVNIINRDAKQLWYFNHYRHGGRKFPMTSLNYLYKFNFDAFDSVSVDDGEIVGIRQIGYTLKIIQQKKITSQYIGRTELLDARGQPSLQRTEQVFGTKNPSDTDYGCYDPGSIVANDRHVYFFDVSKGMYIRDAANGIFPVSMYFMDTFWKDAGQLYSNNKGKYDIYSTFDKRYGDLYITIAPKPSWISEADPSNAPPPFTIHFNEDSNRWKSFWSFTPEGYAVSNNAMVSFVDGQLHRHEVNPLHTNFYGTQRKIELDVYSNEHPKQVKLYRSLTVHSNRLFYCPDTGDVYILPTENYPNGMVSRLTKNQFDPQEGIYYAGFLHDMGDPRFSSQIEALFNGRELRGRALKVRLVSDGDKATKLDFVTVNSVVSEISN